MKTTEKQHVMIESKKKKKGQRINPTTNRRASVSNWEAFKSLISKPRKNSTTQSVTKHRIIKRQNNNKSYLAPEQNMNSMSNGHSNKCNGGTINDKQLTKEIAMDCEMVGIGDGTESMIARVSLVNRYGYCVYDKYVKAREEVQDYRTAVSGIRPHHLENGEEFSVVQKEVAEIIKGRILIGHAIKHDLAVLFISHPRRHLRDTSKYHSFRELARGNTPSLRKLAYELLGSEIQIGEHSSVEDARAAMQLYMLYKNKWEFEIHSKRK